MSVEHIDPSKLRLVLLESPYADEDAQKIARNVAYGRAAMHDCFMRGDAPFASHLLYTQDGVLDDTDPAERLLGIEAGLLWGRLAEVTVVYTDLGISPGMQKGIDRAKAQGRPIEYRSLSGWGTQTDAA